MTTWEVIFLNGVNTNSGFHSNHDFFRLRNHSLSYLNCILMAFSKICFVTLFDCFFGCGGPCYSSLSELCTYLEKNKTIYPINFVVKFFWWELHIYAQEEHRSDFEFSVSVALGGTRNSTLVRESYPQLTDNQPLSSLLLKLCRNKSQSCVVELLLENNVRTTQKSSLNSYLCERICKIQMPLVESRITYSHLVLLDILLPTKSKMRPLNRCNHEMCNCIYLPSGSKFIIVRFLAGAVEVTRWMPAIFGKLTDWHLLPAIRSLICAWFMDPGTMENFLHVTHKLLARMRLGVINACNLLLHVQVITSQIFKHVTSSTSSQIPLHAFHIF